MWWSMEGILKAFATSDGKTLELQKTLTKEKILKQLYTYYCIPATGGFVLPEFLEQFLYVCHNFENLMRRLMFLRAIVLSREK